MVCVRNQSGCVQVETSRVTVSLGDLFKFLTQVLTQPGSGRFSPDDASLSTARRHARMIQAT